MELFTPLLDFVAETSSEILAGVISSVLVADILIKTGSNPPLSTFYNPKIVGLKSTPTLPAT